MEETEIHTGPTVYRAAAAMPDVGELEDRALALAAISAIRGGKLEDCDHYDFQPSDCSGRSGKILRAYVEPRWLEVHFHENDGAVIFLWDRDASTMPFDGECFDLWRKILDEIPDVLRPCLYTDLAMMQGDDSGGLPYITAVMWRRKDDTAWQTSRVLRQEYNVPVEPYEDYDGAEYVLADLIRPWPTTFTIGMGLEDPLPAATLEAVHHVLALRPLTEDTVRALSSDRSLTEAQGLVAALGYPPAAPTNCAPTSA